jgi:heterodisulfide reductase subunit A-like polyferredoxin
MSALSLEIWCPNLVPSSGAERTGAAASTATATFQRQSRQRPAPDAGQSELCMGLVQCLQCTWPFLY